MTKFSWNSQHLDLSIEDEETAADLIEGLRSWLAGSGHILDCLYIDGKHISPDENDRLNTYLLDTTKKISIESIKLPLQCSQVLDEAILYLKKAIHRTKQIDKPFKDDDIPNVCDGLANIQEGLASIPPHLGLTTDHITVDQHSLSYCLEGVETLCKQLKAAQFHPQKVEKIIEKEAISLLSTLLAGCYAIYRHARWHNAWKGKNAQINTNEIREWLQKQLLMHNTACLSIAYHLQEGNDHQALRLLQDLCVCLSQTQRILHERHPSPSSQEMHDDLHMSIKSIEENLEKEDFVIIADILEFELAPSLEKWSEALKAAPTTA